MEPQPLILQQERVDDVPLLLGQMRQLNLADIFDRHLGHHPLHQGLSNGNLLVGYIAYLLSQADHRKSAVQTWANDLQHTLQTFFNQPLRPHEFSDDRLGIALTHLADVGWDAVEDDLFKASFDIYSLPTKVIRVDATASCGYHVVQPDGIMQLGYSKDHRPDLPQLKIMAAVTQPLAFPISTAIVPGNQSDDCLYWSTIVQVKKKITDAGLLFVGDCKMAALDIRARIAQAGDFYLTPLPNTGTTAKLLNPWIDTALELDAAGQLSIQYKRSPKEDATPVAIGRGYEFTRERKADLDEQEITWVERVQIVQSFAHRDSQNTKLKNGLQQAELELSQLTLAGKGRPIWRQEQVLRQAIAVLEQRHGVTGLLRVGLRVERIEKKIYGRSGRPSSSAVGEMAITERYFIASVHRNDAAIAAKEQRHGWRALVTNTPLEQLDLEGSVLTYREGGGLERPFQQLKGSPLGIRPLFVRLEKQIVGLTRLLLIALRVLTLLEIVVRAKLAESDEKLSKIYEGQENREEGKPTGKRLLGAISRLGLSVSLISYGGREWWFLPALPDLLVRVLALLGLSPTLYTDLIQSVPRSPPDEAIPRIPDLHR